MANQLHGESGYPYIRWQLPQEPPKGLDLGPVEQAAATKASGNGRVH